MGCIAGIGLLAAKITGSVLGVVFAIIVVGVIAVKIAAIAAPNNMGVQEALAYALIFTGLILWAVFQSGGTTSG